MRLALMFLLKEKKRNVSVSEAPQKPLQVQVISVNQNILASTKAAASSSSSSLKRLRQSSQLASLIVSDI